MTIGLLVQLNETLEGRMNEHFRAERHIHEHMFTFSDKLEGSWHMDYN